MLEPITKWVRKLHYRNWRDWRPNFITVHYMYMLGWTFIGSWILAGAGNMAYIDALFFSGGAATQSGLNTMDVNKTLIYQQIVLMLMACVCNPIFINTMVSCVRLYWFEKRFAHIAKESRESRRTRTRTFTRTKSGMLLETEKDPRKVEAGMAGVAGRAIRVLHHTTKPNGMSPSKATKPSTARATEVFVDKMGLDPSAQSVSPTPPGGSNKSSDDSDLTEAGDPLDQVSPTEDPRTPVHWMGRNPALQRDVMFADEVPVPEEAIQRPALNSVQTDRHIQFIEQQQRNAQSGVGTLRIPGPRDFDNGETPKELEVSNNSLMRPDTRNTLGPTMSDQDRAIGSPQSRDEELNGDHPRRGITIDEPDHPARHTKDKDEDDHGNSTSIMQSLNRAKARISHKRDNSDADPTARRIMMAKTFSSMRTARSSEKEPMPYLSWQATIGRNSAFIDLTQEQREELGGIEYRSLKTLIKILVGYFVGFHAIGMIILIAWIECTKRWKEGVVKADGVMPGWWAVFTSASMFNDLGFTLTPDSMVSFQTATLPLLIGSFLIIIGNTGFPIMLRFMIWVVSKFTWPDTPLYEEVHFLLDHPRRCFTLLFPSRATWVLFWVLVALNAVDLVFFIILDLKDDTVTSLAPGFRVLSGWFQATSTRTAGFACVNLADLHPGIQVSYLVMMYISVFPVAISVRRTNVYEEKSLGIFGGEEEEAEEGEQSYVGQHLRRQLSFDLWFVFLGFFIICCVEGDRLQNTNEYAFTMFSVLFEIVSAYGTVGLSLGYPGINASFSAEFHVISKLVILAMMIRGRHRGLPYALDRAILLPSENMHKKDMESTSVRRRNSEFGRQFTWEDGDLDNGGLPMQHTGARAQAMAAGAGGGETSPQQNPERFRKVLPRRRSSNMSNGSGGVGVAANKRPERRFSLATLAGGFGVGPTSFSKDD